MSTFAARTVRCPCGALRRADLADGLHITRLPEVRQKILDGTFHHVACYECGRVSVVQTKTLYTDFERLHWVAVAPPWLVSDWPSWAGIVSAEFDHNLRVAASPLVSDLAERFTVRLVFGLDALAEKLHAWDAGLDDRLVEGLKLRLYQARRERFGPGFRLRLSGVSRERWELTFTLSHPRDPEVDVFGLSLVEYLESERNEAELASVDGLLATPFGGLDRLFASSQGGATPADDFMRVVEPMRPQDDDEGYPRRAFDGR